MFEFNNKNNINAYKNTYNNSSYIYKMSRYDNYLIFYKIDILQKKL